jgi:hypothetical protein
MLSLGVRQPSSLPSLSAAVERKWSLMTDGSWKRSPGREVAATRVSLVLIIFEAPGSSRVSTEAPQF